MSAWGSSWSSFWGNSWGALAAVERLLFNTNAWIRNRRVAVKPEEELTVFVEAEDLVIKTK